MPKSTAPSEKTVETADEPSNGDDIQKPAGRLAKSKAPAEAAAPAAPATKPSRRCS